jgi:hypothetical protein
MLVASFLTRFVDHVLELLFSLSTMRDARFGHSGEIRITVAALG